MKSHRSSLFLVLLGTVVWGVASGGAVGQVVGIPEQCQPPDWVKQNCNRHGTVPGIASVEATGDPAADRARALVAAVKKLWLRIDGAGTRWLAFVGSLGRPMYSEEGGGMVSTGLAAGASDQEVVDTFMKKAELKQEFWEDACRGKVWCFTCAPGGKAKKAAETLLKNTTPDRVLEDALRKLATHAMDAGFKAVVYRVDEEGISGAMGDYLAGRLGQIASSNQIFTSVPKNRLDQVLVTNKVPFDDLWHGSDELKNAVCAAADVVITGRYWKEGQFVKLYLALMDCRGKLLHAETGTIAVSALPKHVQRTAKEEEALRSDRAEALAEQKRKEEEERRRWEQEKLAELRETARKQVWEEERPKIEEQVKKEKDAEYKKRLQEGVAQRLGELQSTVEQDKKKMYDELLNAKMDAERLRLKAELETKEAQDRKILEEELAARLEAERKRLEAEAKTAADAEAARKLAEEKVRLENEARERLAKDLASRQERDKKELAAQLEAERTRLEAEAKKAAEVEAVRRLEENKKRVEAEVTKRLEQEHAVRVKEEVDARVQSEVNEQFGQKYQEFQGGSAPDSPLVVKAWLDKGCGATYRLTEKAIVYVRCNRDCYVKVFHLSAEGELKLVFPNQFDRTHNFLRGGQVYSIGDATYPFYYEIEPPLGAETVTVVASEKQFDDMGKVKKEYTRDGGLASYGKTRGSAYSKVLYRGMGAKKRKHKIPDSATMSRENCSLMVVE